MQSAHALIDRAIREAAAAGAAMASPSRAAEPPAPAAASAAVTSPDVKVSAAVQGGMVVPEGGAALEIHNSGDWRQSSRAGVHEKSSEYARRIMTQMPLHDALV